MTIDPDTLGLSPEATRAVKAGISRRGIIDEEDALMESVVLALEAERDGKNVFSVVTKGIEKLRQRESMYGMTGISRDEYRAMVREDKENYEAS